MVYRLGIESVKLFDVSQHEFQQVHTNHLAKFCCTSKQSGEILLFFCEIVYNTRINKNRRMCMKEDIPGPKYFNGDNPWDMI